MPKNLDEKHLTIDAYNKIAQKFSDSHYDETFYKTSLDKFNKMIKGKKVLDIGCGAGRDADYFIKNGFDYTGIDASVEMLKMASKRVPNSPFKQMDFYHLEFPNDTFDGFWAAASFLHVPKKDVGILISEAARVIKPNGIGFISVKEDTGTPEGLIEQKIQGGIVRYFAFYSEEELKTKILDNGLDVIETIRTIEDDERKTVWLCYLVRKPDNKSGATI